MKPTPVRHDTLAGGRRHDLDRVRRAKHSRHHNDKASASHFSERRDGGGAWLRRQLTLRDRKGVAAVVVVGYFEQSRGEWCRGLE